MARHHEDPVYPPAHEEFETEKKYQEALEGYHNELWFERETSYSGEAKHGKEPDVWCAEDEYGDIEDHGDEDSNEDEDNCANSYGYKAKRAHYPRPGTWRRHNSSTEQTDDEDEDEGFVRRTSVANSTKSTKSAGAIKRRGEKKTGKGGNGKVKDMKDDDREDDYASDADDEDDGEVEIDVENSGNEEE